MFGVSRWTIHQRVIEFQLRDTSGFSIINDKALDPLIFEYFDRYSRTTSQALIARCVWSLGLHVQRSRSLKGVNQIGF